MSNPTELPDLDRLEALARAATPQNLDSAQDATKPTGYIECPGCGGDGTVELTADYCNYDGKAMGVQFYGIGPEHQAAEAFFRAANPAAVLALVELARRAQPESEAPQADAAVIVPKFEGQFDSHQDWVNRAQRVLSVPSHKPNAICVDAKGRRCHIGADMRRASEEGAFPVRYFWECELAKPAATLSPLCGAQHAESGAPAAVKRALELYAESYDRMSRMGDGKVSCADVDYDIRCNMVGSVLKSLAAQSQDTGLLKVTLEQAKARLVQADARIEELEAAQSQGAQVTVEFVPIATGSRDVARGTHPNDNTPADPTCQAALDARGDNRGQGLDPYWKWGFRAGWQALAAQQAAAPGALNEWRRLDMDDKPDASRWIDVVLDNGVTEYSRTYALIDWTAVRDWRYSAPGTPGAPKGGA